MKQTLNLSLGEFALAALVKDDPQDRDEVVARRVRRAIRYYLAEKEPERPGWSYPTFLDRDNPGKQISISLEIDAAVWGEFELEAGQQHVAPDRLAEHAVLYFIADRDAGRVTQRILDDED